MKKYVGQSIPMMTNRKLAAGAGQFTADVMPGAGDSLQLFLADVGRHRLLTAAEEVTLAKRIEKSLEPALAEVGLLKK